MKQAGKIYSGWWIVAVSAVGLSTGPGQFAFGALGLFIVPLGNEFGWDRAQISLALTFFTVALALTLPFVGGLVDRFGSREVLLPSMIIVAIGLLLIPLVVTDLWHLLVIFTLMGCLGAGANALPYMRTLSAWFDRRRGLAIGIAMGGAGSGYAYVPPLVQHMIDSYGWRSGYFCLVAITLFVAVPIIYLFLRDPGVEDVLAEERAVPGKQAGTIVTGLTITEALKTREIWLLFGIFSLLSFCLYGLLAHLVPMLTDRGMPATDAALVASSLGITIVIARIVIGYLVDHFFAPRVALLCFILTAAGLALLANGAVYTLAFVATIFIGFSMGAEIDLLAYLTSRYFGLKSFGQVYGVLFASFLAGASLGPVSFGMTFEATGSYVSVLLLSIALIVVACIGTAMLPKYPEFRTS